MPKRTFMVKVIATLLSDFILPPTPYMFCQPVSFPLTPLPPFPPCHPMLAFDLVPPPSPYLDAMIYEQPLKHRA